MRYRLIAAAALAASMSVALLGCTGGPVKTTTSSAPATGATTSRAQPVTLADARHCPVTIGHPVPRTKPWREQLFGWSSAYGNGSLWVGALWPHGVVIMTPDDVNPDGSLGMKFGWYRLTSGLLSITGRRLDAPAPPLSGQASNYGLTGFNASGVRFPTEGCWQVTGRVGRVALTFVTFVIKGHCDLNADPIRCAADRIR
jgi:hypothetical protein